MKARRLFSVKEKHSAHRRNRSSETGNKTNAGESFKGLFKPDAARHLHEDQEKQKAKVEDVLQQLAEAEITDISHDYAREMLNGQYAAGSVLKAVEFIEMQASAASGTIVPYDPKVPLLGAVNRESVTCYLDALLFAMFAKLTAYECMLTNDFPDDPAKKNLATMLRLWVNMIRSGKLITTDITKMLQEALAESGWPEAGKLEQQDTSEAFAFITETLRLPLLQLQVDLFHQGKRDDDDHKIVHERLLNLAVPSDPEGKGVKLEDCLEEYFNTRVDVSRDRHEEKEDSRRPAAPRLNTIRLVTREDEPDVSEKPAKYPPQMLPSLQRRAMSDFPPGESKEGGVAGSSRPPTRHRSTSVIQHVLVDDEGRPAGSGSDSSSSLLGKARRKSSTVVKAVTIPAWQFFRLIPWHAVGNDEPKNNVDVATNLSQRPVVGICLKRYAYNERHHPIRLRTYIDIPDSLRLPHFMLADEKHLEDDTNGLSTEYKLVLQSVVCHRGDSVTSGHYISFARVAPKLLTDNRRHDFDPPPDYEEAQWVKFDDLQTERRVTYVDDIKKALKEEMPYLLFYQIVPMVEVATTEETEGEPPSYSDSKASIAASTAPSLSDSGHFGCAQMTDSDYFDHQGAAAVPNKASDASVRLSSDLEHTVRSSFDEREANASDFQDSRRGSVVFVDHPQQDAPARTPDTASPGITPSGVTPGEESTRDRFSRAAAIFTTKSRSRPPSQPGEGRTGLSMGMGMGRLGGLIRTSKDPLRDVNPATNDSLDVSVVSSAELPRPSFDSESRVAVTTADGAETSDGKAVESSTPRKHTHHHHRRSKVKVKGVQPERECVVM